MRRERDAADDGQQRQQVSGRSRAPSAAAASATVESGSADLNVSMNAGAAKLNAALVSRKPIV